MRAGPEVGVKESPPAHERLLIGPETAEAAKIACGSAAPLGHELETDVAGRDRITGLLRRTTLTADAVRNAIEPPVATIVDTVKRTLEGRDPAAGSPSPSARADLPVAA